MFFGKKRKSPKRKSPKRKSPKRETSKPTCGVILIRGKERKVYTGPQGACYYKTKSGKTYVDKERVKNHKKFSPKRKSPKRKSPKRKSPKRKSPKRKGKKMNYGYGLGQPSLAEMMGPASLYTFIPAAVSATM